MTSLKTSSMLAALAVATGIGLAVPAAHAADPTVTFNVSPNPNSFYTVSTYTVTDHGANPASAGTSLGNGYVGAFDASYVGDANGGGSVLTYCCDLYHDIASPFTADLANNTGASAKPLAADGYYDGGGLVSALNDPTSGYNVKGTLSNSLRANAVSWLNQFSGYTPGGPYTFSTLFGGTDTATYAENQAAVNVAIWDIVQDGGGHGDVTVSGGADSAVVNALANQFEDLGLGLDGTAAGNSYWVQSARSNPGLQEFVVLNTKIPIISQFTPEPSMFVTSFSLMGMVGTGLIKGRRRMGARKAA